MLKLNPSQQEAYEAGNMALESLNEPQVTPPMWALSLGFSMEGCFVVIKQDDLLRSCNSLVRNTETSPFAYLELLQNPTKPQHYQEYFRALELMDINLLAGAEDVTIECFGATLTTTRQKKTGLNGRFSITGSLGPDIPLIRPNVRGTLVLSHSPDTHVTLSSSGVVPYFKVPAWVTMDPTEFREGWASFGHVDNPLFGSFSLEKVKDNTKEAHSLGLWGSIRRLSRQKPE